MVYYRLYDPKTKKFIKSVSGSLHCPSVEITTAETALLTAKTLSTVLVRLTRIPTALQKKTNELEKAEANRGNKLDASLKYLERQIQKLQEITDMSRRIEVQECKIVTNAVNKNDCLKTSLANSNLKVIREELLATIGRPVVEWFFRKLKKEVKDGKIKWPAAVATERLSYSWNAGTEREKLQKQYGMMRDLGISFKKSSSYTVSIEIETEEDLNLLHLSIPKEELMLIVYNVEELKKKYSDIVRMQNLNMQLFTKKLRCGLDN